MSIVRLRWLQHRALRSPGHVVQAPATERRNDGGRTGAPQSSQRSRSRHSRVPWQLCPVPGTPKARLPAMAGSCTRRGRDLKAPCTLIGSCPQGIFQPCSVPGGRQWSCGESARNGKMVSQKIEDSIERWTADMTGAGDKLGAIVRLGRFAACLRLPEESHAKTGHLLRFQSEWLSAALPPDPRSPG
jgi:hypothetical protein